MIYTANGSSSDLILAKGDGCTKELSAIGGQLVVKLPSGLSKKNNVDPETRNGLKGRSSDAFVKYIGNL